MYAISDSKLVVVSIFEKSFVNICLTLLNNMRKSNDKTEKSVEIYGKLVFDNIELYYFL